MKKYTLKNNDEITKILADSGVTGAIIIKNDGNVFSFFKDENTKILILHYTSIFHEKCKKEKKQLAEKWYKEENTYIQQLNNLSKKEISYIG